MQFYHFLTTDSDTLRLWLYLSNFKHILPPIVSQNFLWWHHLTTWMVQSISKFNAESFFVANTWNFLWLPPLPLRLHKCPIFSAQILQFSFCNRPDFLRQLAHLKLRQATGNNLFSFSKFPLKNKIKFVGGVHPLPSLVMGAKGKGLLGSGTGSFFSFREIQ